LARMSFSAACKAGPFFTQRSGTDKSVPFQNYSI